MPVSADEAERLGATIYRISSSPFKFQDAVLVGAGEGYYGECRFEIDLSTPEYVKLDRSVLRGLFGKFNPSRGDLVFSKTGELTVVFWVYGQTLSDGKPDVSIEFNFHTKQGDGTEKYFNKTAPQELNAKTLPEFNAAAGHQLLGSQTIPVSVFPAGDYRLEIKVTDKPSGKVVTQNVTFTVTG